MLLQDFLLIASSLIITPIAVIIKWFTVLKDYRTLPAREYELMTEAHAKLYVVRNCSRSSLPVCLGEGEQFAGGGRSAAAGGGGRQTVHREREFGAV
jgi:hypothetical protein